LRTSIRYLLFSRNLGPNSTHGSSWFLSSWSSRTLDRSYWIVSALCIPMSFRVVGQGPRAG
jgi:hypothetical protein